MSSEFKFKVGEEVWFLGVEGKARIAKITRRCLVEGELVLSIDYTVLDAGDNTIYDKPESSLFSDPAYLINDLFSERSEVSHFCIRESELIISDQQKNLWDLCGRFVDENRIECSETIWQTDHVEENAREFIDKVCEIVGYHEPETEDNE